MGGELGDPHAPERLHRRVGVQSETGAHGTLINTKLKPRGERGFLLTYFRFFRREVVLRFAERRRVARFVVFRFARRAGFRFATFRLRFFAGIRTTSLSQNEISQTYFYCNENMFATHECYAHTFAKATTCKHIVYKNILLHYVALMKTKKLPREFYERDTHVVAKELLGKLLVRTWHGKKLIVRITEVESYVGEDDKASHASRGRTPRTTVMYGEPGRAYVYLIYGMYYCLNVVTEKKGFPAAVLIRAAGEFSGPGKLCRGLHIGKAQNRLDVTRNPLLYIADDGFRPRPRDIIATPRIGVDYAGEHALLPWRYYITL